MGGPGSSDTLVFLGIYMTTDRSLDLSRGLLICKRARNTLPFGLLQTSEEAIIVKLTLLQVQVPQTFPKHLLPVTYSTRHFLPLFHSTKSSYSGAGDNNGKWVLSGGTDDTRLAWVDNYWIWMRGHKGSLYYFLYFCACLECSTKTCILNNHPGLMCGGSY